MSFFMSFIDMCVAFELEKSRAMEVFIICNGITFQKLEYIVMVVTTLLFKLSSTHYQTMDVKVKFTIKGGYHSSNWWSLPCILIFHHRQVVCRA
jgi:hypothetical protein